ncbi:helix-hairpin-helix domain-containing protein [Litoribacillus peritrichatus]|uniref:Helix-hairpin-helix DNA-binding motif class 1 domain-containing protein n=1 Tax=Litoribacillus peritrichatus TaxID=718191 RepID=A0ABP7M389_9GAMM
MKKLIVGCWVLLFSLSLWAIEPVNINNASKEELESLKGIGPVLAERIIQYREENGGFSEVHQLAEISGISDKWVQTNLQVVQLSD